MSGLLVTWIAPTVNGLPKLAWLDELGRMQRIPGVTVLTATGDTVLLDDVATVLRSPADVIVWSGHGTPGGLMLSDSSLVRTKWLAAQVARVGRIKVVVLASCSSQLRDATLCSLTEAICRVGVNVIGFPAKTDDLAAGTFSIEYVRALSVNSSVVEAFDVALEAISEEEKTVRGVFLTPGIRDIPFSLEDRLTTICESLSRIELISNMRSTGPLPVEKIEVPAEEETSSPSGIQSLSRGNVPRIRVGHIRGIGLNE